MDMITYAALKKQMQAAGSGSGSLGVRYGFDANTGTLYLYGDGEFYGNGRSNHEDINAQVKHIVFFENVSSVHDWACCAGYPNLETVTFCNSVTSIGFAAFKGCEKLRKVYLPKNITLLEDSVFDTTGIEKITIPAAVTNMGNTFQWCEKLKSVVFERGSELVGIDSTYAFADCISLERINLPNKLVALPNYTFKDDAALRQVYLPVSLTSIGQNCFENCSALEYVLYGGTGEQWEQISIGTGNGSITQDNLYFFSESGLDESAGEKNDETDADATGAMCELFCNAENDAYFAKYYLPENADNDTYYAIGPQYAADSFVVGADICEGIREVRAGAFYGCALKEIKLPDSLEVIGAEAFAYCDQLENISIPDGVSIGYLAFEYCDSLKRVYIPKGCKIEIDALVFDNCPALTDIYYGGSEKEFCGHLEEELTASDMERMLGRPDNLYTLHYNATGLPE